MDFASARRRAPLILCAHPSDLDRLCLADGAECWVVSGNGRIPGIVRADATLKRGVVSMNDGFGGLWAKPWTTARAVFDVVADQPGSPPLRAASGHAADVRRAGAG